jgi:hypothetical protein
MNLNQLGLEPTDNSNVFIARMRFQRDRLLAASDWAVLPDAPTDKEAWAAYRQALRDFPVTWVPSEEANFPDVPTAVTA